MSVGRGLLKAVFEAGSSTFASLSERGITSELFREDERRIYEYAHEFFLNHGGLPELSIIRAELNITVDWDSLPTAPVSYWIDKVIERDVLTRAGEHVTAFNNALAARDIVSLRSALQSAYSQIENNRHSQSVRMLSDVAGDVIRDHNRVREFSGTIPGVPFAFPFLNASSGGMWGGDIIALVGRPGTGKSYLLLNDSLSAHSDGYRTLVFSMEMPIIQCGRRLVCLRTAVNYTRLRLGMVSVHGMDLIESDRGTMVEEPPFHIVSGGIFGTVDRFHAQIKQHRPDIVFLDGAYLLRLAGKKGSSGARWERTLQVLEVIKNIALAEDIPIYITYQFNRTAPGTLEGIAFTDGVSQLASMVISLEHDGSGNEAVTRPIQYKILKLLKGREGESGKLRVMLDFQNMTFRQDEVLEGLADEVESAIEDGGIAPDPTDEQFARI